MKNLKRIAIFVSVLTVFLVFSQLSVFAEAQSNTQSDKSFPFTLNTEMAVKSANLKNWSEPATFPPDVFNLDGFHVNWGTHYNYQPYAEYVIDNCVEGKYIFRVTYHTFTAFPSSILVNGVESQDNWAVTQAWDAIAGNPVSTFGTKDFIIRLNEGQNTIRFEGSYANTNSCNTAHENESCGETRTANKVRLKNALLTEYNPTTVYETKSLTNSNLSGETSWGFVKDETKKTNIQIYENGRYVKFPVSVKEAGEYFLDIEYACNDDSMGRIYINDTITLATWEPTNNITDGKAKTTTTPIDIGSYFRTNVAPEKDSGGNLVAGFFTNKLVKVNLLKGNNTILFIREKDGATTYNKNLMIRKISLTEAEFYQKNYVTPVILYVDGKATWDVLNTIVSKDVAKAQINAKFNAYYYYYNNSGTDEVVTPIYAFYNGNALEEIKLGTETTVSSGADINIKSQLTPPSDYTHFKVFLWNMNTQNPFMSTPDFEKAATDYVFPQ